ncbi:MAG: hypothetical protein WKG01_08470 [Kofleriaceae bacterium]
MRAWARRAVELHGELVELADPDPRWWLLAGGAAIAEAAPARAGYIIADAEPTADTFLGHVAPPPRDPFADAIERAKAARTAIRELDGCLPDQRLSVTLRDDGGRAITVASSLTHGAFAIGDRCIVVALDDITPAHLAANRHTGPRHVTPFVCVSIGDDPIATARHGHRRAWIDGAGPWLGLGRAGELSTVSTCHMVVDGYGHARIAARIAELVPATPGAPVPVPALAPVPGAIPLGIAWRGCRNPHRAWSRSHTRWVACCTIAPAGPTPPSRRRSRSRSRRAIATTRFASAAASSSPHSASGSPATCPSHMPRSRRGRATGSRGKRAGSG